MPELRVLVGSRSFGKANPAAIERLRAAGLDVAPNERGRAYRADELRAAIPGVAALITGVDEVTAEVIAAADCLRVIAKHGVGLDNVDLAAADARGIPVLSTPGAIHHSVADLAMALLLALARTVPAADASMRAGRWEKFVGVELHGLTLGVVGTGRIGKEVAARATAFGMRVLGYDLYPDERFAAGGLTYAPLPELLAASDAVTLHASLDPTAPPLLGRAELAAIKPTAWLVNTARAGLVDDAALLEALREGRLGGAGLDVFRVEPPGPEWAALPNVVLTPHLGGQTAQGLRRMDELTASHVLQVLRPELTEATR